MGGPDNGEGLSRVLRAVREIEKKSRFSHSVLALETRAGDQETRQSLHFWVSLPFILDIRRSGGYPREHFLWQFHPEISASVTSGPHDY